MALCNAHDGCRGRVRRGDIEARTADCETLVAKCRATCVDRSLIAAIDDDVRAGGCECQCKYCAQPSRCPGDECDTAREVEQACRFQK